MVAFGRHIVACALIALPALSQPPTTSDSRQVRQSPANINPLTLPQRTPVYVRPADDVFEVIVTNRIPIVVVEEVYSNVVRRTVWHQRGELRTNDTVLCTNLISRVTNAVPTLSP